MDKRRYFAPVPQGAELCDQPIGPSTAPETASQPLDDFQNAFSDLYAYIVEANGDETLDQALGLDSVNKN